MEIWNLNVGVCFIYLKFWLLATTATKFLIMPTVYYKLNAWKIKANRSYVVKLIIPSNTRIPFMSVHCVKSPTFVGLTEVLWNPTAISSGCINSPKLQLLSALSNIWLSTLHFQYSICYCRLIPAVGPAFLESIPHNARLSSAAAPEHLESLEPLPCTGTTQSLLKEKEIAAKWPGQIIQHARSCNLNHKWWCSFGDRLSSALL